jgi:nucleoid-associated protein YgaU
MNNSGRIALLSSAVFLLLVGVVFLRQRFGHSDAPPAFVPAADAAAARQASGVTHQPTILSADPSSDLEVPHAAPWDPASHPSRPNSSALSPTYPIRVEHPAGGVSGDTAPIPLPPLTPSGDAGLQAVPQSSSPPSPEGQPHDGPKYLHEPPPTTQTDRLKPLTVVTRRNDSLWSISERAYGVGLYYRALFAFNRDRIARPDWIEAGIELVTPPVDQLRKLYPDLCPDEPSNIGSGP